MIYEVEVRQTVTNYQRVEVAATDEKSAKRKAIYAAKQKEEAFCDTSKPKYRAVIIKTN